MTKKQYLEMKQAARRDAEKDDFNVGFSRAGDYIVFYSRLNGYEAQYSPIQQDVNLYKYARACRRLAQLSPNTSAEQLNDCKEFLKRWKK